MNRLVTYSVETLDKGMIHVLGTVDQDGRRFHHNPQNDTQFKTYELFIFWNFPFIAFKLGVAETVESESSGKGGLLYSTFCLYQFIHKTFEKRS